MLELTSSHNTKINYTFHEKFGFLDKHCKWKQINLKRTRFPWIFTCDIRLIVGLIIYSSINLIHYQINTIYLIDIKYFQVI